MSFKQDRMYGRLQSNALVLDLWSTAPYRQETAISQHTEQGMENLWLMGINGDLLAYINQGINGD